MRKALLIGGFLLAAGTSVLLAAAPANAPDKRESPKSIAGQTAIGKYDQAVKNAEEAWKNAEIKAESQLIGDLTNAITIATKNGQLDEANLLVTLKKDAEGRLNDLKNPQPASPTATDTSVWRLEGKFGPFAKSEITIRPNGTFDGHERTLGTWKMEGKNLTLHWNTWHDKSFDPDGRFDYFVMSDDGKTMSGKNNNGQSISATKSGKSDTASTR